MKDISSVVWIGCLLLLFLAVAVHEGWFSHKASPILTSGSNSANNPGGGTSTIDGEEVIWPPLWDILTNPWGAGA
jgi:hypothetical protein